VIKLKYYVSREDGVIRAILSVRSLTKESSESQKQATASPHASPRHSMSGKLITLYLEELDYHTISSTIQQTVNNRYIAISEK